MPCLAIVCIFTANKLVLGENGGSGGCLEAKCGHHVKHGHSLTEHLFFAQTPTSCPLIFILQRATATSSSTAVVKMELWNTQPTVCPSNKLANLVFLKLRPTEWLTVVDTRDAKSSCKALDYERYGKVMMFLRINPTKHPPSLTSHYKRSPYTSWS